MATRKVRHMFFSSLFVGSGMEKTESEINIPAPQHCQFRTSDDIVTRRGIIL